MCQCLHLVVDFYSNNVIHLFNYNFLTLYSQQPLITSLACTLSAEVVKTVKVHKSLVMRKPAFCICENKDADQLRGNPEADQRLCFRYTDSTIPLLPKYEISSL